MERKIKLKDIFLLFLILLGLVLLLQIWFRSSSLPYNSVNEQLQESLIRPIAKWFGHGKNGTFSQNIQELLLPKKIVLNQSNQRAVLYSGDEAFGKVLPAADSLLEALMMGKTEVKSKETVSEEDYCAVLKGNSVYLDYGILLDFRLLSVNICAQEKNDLSSDFTNVRECIISLEDNVFHNTAIYMKDYESGNFFRYLVTANKNELDAILKSYFQTHQSESTLNYSFELNFHKQEKGDGALSKLVFQPLILFNLVPSEGVVLEEEAAHEPDSAHVNGILRAFQINPMTMNKYTDLTNADIFVENNATLVLSPEGYLAYQTVEGGTGLSLIDTKEKNNMDVYSAVSAAVGFLYTLNEEIPMMNFSEYRFSSDLTEGSTSGSYTIEFDYCVDGIPVLQSDPTNGEACHAISMTIENGCLKQYRQFMHTYRSSQKQERLTPVIQAVDGLLDQLNLQKQNLTISHVTKCYWNIGKETALLPQWEIGVESIDSILTVR